MPALGRAERPCSALIRLVRGRIGRRPSKISSLAGLNLHVGDRDRHRGRSGKRPVGVAQVTWPLTREAARPCHRLRETRRDPAPDCREGGSVGPNLLRARDRAIARGSPDRVSGRDRREGQSGLPWRRVGAALPHRLAGTMASTARHASERSKSASASTEWSTATRPSTRRSRQGASATLPP
jgi:hypothetical protein